ncbi:hypothetical protein HOD08_01220 [bacterium]|nr:hypothetical protein [bacterium]
MKPFSRGTVLLACLLGLSFGRASADAFFDQGIQKATALQKKVMKVLSVTSANPIVLNFIKELNELFKFRHRAQLANVIKLGTSIKIVGKKYYGMANALGASDQALKSQASNLLAWLKWHAGVWDSKKMTRLGRAQAPEGSPPDGSMTLIKAVVDGKEKYFRIVSEGGKIHLKADVDTPIGKECQFKVHADHNLVCLEPASTTKKFVSMPEVKSKESWLKQYKEVETRARVVARGNDVSESTLWMEITWDKSKNIGLKGLATKGFLSFGESEYARSLKATDYDGAFLRYTKATQGVWLQPLGNAIGRLEELRLVADVESRFAGFTEIVTENFISTMSDITFLLNEVLAFIEEWRAGDAKWRRFMGANGPQLVEDIVAVLEGAFDVSGSDKILEQIKAIRRAVTDGAKKASTLVPTINGKSIDGMIVVMMSEDNKILAFSDGKFFKTDDEVDYLDSVAHVLIGADSRGNITIKSKASGKYFGAGSIPHDMSSWLEPARKDASRAEFRSTSVSASEKFIIEEDPSVEGKFLIKNIEIGGFIRIDDDEYIRNVDYQNPTPRGLLPPLPQRYATKFKFLEIDDFFQKLASMRQIKNILNRANEYNEMLPTILTEKHVTTFLSEIERFLKKQRRNENYWGKLKESGALGVLKSIVRSDRIESFSKSSTAIKEDTDKVDLLFKDDGVGITAATVFSGYDHFSLRVETEGDYYRKILIVQDDASVKTSDDDETFPAGHIKVEAVDDGVVLSYGDKYLAGRLEIDEDMLEDVKRELKKLKFTADSTEDALKFVEETPQKTVTETIGEGESASQTSKDVDDPDVIPYTGLDRNLSDFLQSGGRKIRLRVDSEDSQEYFLAIENDHLSLTRNESMKKVAFKVIPIASFVSILSGGTEAFDGEALKVYDSLIYQVSHMGELNVLLLAFKKFLGKPRHDASVFAGFKALRMEIEKWCDAVGERFASAFPKDGDAFATWNSAAAKLSKEHFPPTPEALKSYLGQLLMSESFATRVVRIQDEFKATGDDKITKDNIDEWLSKFDIMADDRADATTEQIAELTDFIDSKIVQDHDLIFDTRQGKVVTEIREKFLAEVTYVDLVNRFTAMVKSKVKFDTSDEELFWAKVNRLIKERWRAPREEFDLEKIVRLVKHTVDNRFSDPNSNKILMNAKISQLRTAAESSEGEEKYLTYAERIDAARDKLKTIGSRASDLQKITEFVASMKSFLDDRIDGTKEEQALLISFLQNDVTYHSHVYYNSTLRGQLQEIEKGMWEPATYEDYVANFKKLLQVRIFTEAHKTAFINKLNLLVENRWQAASSEVVEKIKGDVKYAMMNRFKDDILDDKVQKTRTGNDGKPLRNKNIEDIEALIEQLEGGGEMTLEIDVKNKTEHLKGLPSESRRDMPVEKKEEWVDGMEVLVSNIYGEDLETVAESTTMNLLESIELLLETTIATILLPDEDEVMKNLSDKIEKLLEEVVAAKTVVTDRAGVAAASA